MPTYNTLLFDVDDTLLDFAATEKAALIKLFAHEQVTLSSAIETRYQIINHHLWRRFEQGQISQQEVVSGRFQQLFDELGIARDGSVCDERFREYLAEGHFLIEGARPLIEKLHQQVALYVVTNGVSSTQYRRLTDSGLMPYFKDVFVSEDTGFQKPMSGFFDHVFERIPQFNKADTMIIGDSLTSDIKGGNMAGIATCWYNPARKDSQGYTPTFEIAHLDEVIGLTL
ncbi:YjjG family noncanonical pyrimidine nucleotidase [Brochothrix campestris]|uniref:Hydrolase n=1 Tax=Brochothrix campestris FSL F6-1037 TaxID=1265861 RepID=W7CZD1_9LIST|nr:YjjG family noncanonical pyrimidine nucleotidase [Brochothrix campestris]EUJ38363.1 hydrolase [Brochothrix campestris FSL F6-1037]